MNFEMVDCAWYNFISTELYMEAWQIWIDVAQVPKISNTQLSAPEYQIKPCRPPPFKLENKRLKPQFQLHIRNKERKRDYS